MSREPDEGPGDGDCSSAAAGGSSGSPEDEFDRIVAAWRAEGSVPDWPQRAAPDPTAEDEPTAATPHRASPTRSEDVPDAEDDHYHPPDPPPMPRPGPPAFVGGGLIVLGLLLVAVPETLGLSNLYGLPLGLLGIAGGLTWLVMRMWPSERSEDDPTDGDDGAVL